MATPTKLTNWKFFIYYEFYDYGGTSKVSAAIDSFDEDNENSACGQLTAFANHVNAQTDKKILQEQADQVFDILSEVVDSFNNECTNLIQSIGR